MHKLALVSTMLVLVSASAQAQKTPSTELLEQGIYAEETIGDLNQAIAIYSKIVKDDKAQRPEVAQALFRLAVCHLHLGHKDKSNQMFHQLIDEYSDQTDLVAEARKLVTQDRIALGSIPWKNGEVAFYDIKRSGGGKIGAAAFSANEALVDGLPAWKLSTHTSLLIAGQTDYTDTYVTRDDFIALSGNSFSAVLGQNRIDYKKGGPHVSSLVKGKKTVNDIAIGQPYYNDLQLHDMIRRLSPKSGYQTEFTLFIQGSTLALNARLAVKDLEKVGVPAGDFDCYRVEIKAYQQSKLTQEMTYWVSTKADKQIVKVLSSSFTYELTAVANRNDQPLVYQKQSLNISLTAPQGWMPMEIEPMQPGHDIWVSLIPDESHTFALLAGTQKLKASNDDKNEKRVERVVDGDIKALSSALPGFVLRPETRVKLVVSGASAQRFIADFEADNKPMVEYRTYILAPSGLFWFTFRAERAIFNEKRAEYDAIVDNLTLN
jgi:tetratricopeptide (TPR) repeat protein